MRTQLILVIQEHAQFGWRFILYSALPKSTESWEISGIPDKETGIKEGASDTEIRLIEAAAEVSDEALIKAYSKEKDKSKIPTTTIETLIRPRIEKNVSKILTLAEQADIPIYFREKNTEKVFYALNRVELLPEKSRCLFNFIKEQQGLRYFISLINNGEEIPLQQRGIILSQDPCVILLGKNIHRVADTDAKKLLPFFTKTHIDVPPASEKVYMEKFIVKTIAKHDVHIEGIDMQEKTPKKRAVLVLEEDLFQQMALHLFFEYDRKRFFPAISTTRKIVDVESMAGKEQIVWFHRDREWESRLLQQLEALGLQQKGENRFYLNLNREEAPAHPLGLIAWMNEHREALTDFLLEQKTEHTYYSGGVTINSKMESKIDWFDLEIEVVLDNYRIPFSRFKNHILSRNPEYILPNGSIFILPEEWFARYHHLFLFGETEEKKVRIKKTYLGIVRGFLPEGNDISEEGKDVKWPIPSKNLDALLRPYQRDGFHWILHLLRNNYGGCLADDMGLGKTVQVITLLDYLYSSVSAENLPVKKANFQSTKKEQLNLFSDKEDQPSLPASLVVVPTSLIHNWRNELKKFAPGMKTYIHSGNDRIKSDEIGKIFNHYHLIISSYPIVRNDVDYLAKYPFLYLILDESQYIKNPDSATNKAVHALQSTYRLALTGTPVENSLTDLWSQMDFINPGLLGTLSSFKDNFITKITKEKNEKAQDSLLKIIRPFILRRTKEEVTPDLPPLTEDIIYCEMAERQQEIYTEEKNRIRNRLLEDRESFYKDRFSALQSLMRLRLLSNHPALTDPKYTDESGKFEQILSHFESIKAAGHKVLIFSSFVKHLNLLARAFEWKNWKYAMLTGHTKDREKEIARFNNKDVNCFFISLKAGGTGLNLTAADYVFIIDPWWNPAAEEQALSRAHRIGQDKPVIVYRFITSNSIEEKIIRLQAKKKELADAFVISHNPLASLQPEEVESLFE